jgi:hypothetical protein
MSQSGNVMSMGVEGENMVLSTPIVKKKPNLPRHPICKEAMQAGEWKVTRNADGKIVKMDRVG